jgi:hypothetical protein
MPDSGTPRLFMTDPSQPSRFPSWLAPAVVVMMGMQLALTWLNGSLLHRQHMDMLALREDVQTLSEALEQGTSEEDTAGGSIVPARLRPARSQRIQRVRLIQAAPTEEEQAQKDLQNARASAQKAVSEAREVQSKLSIEENIRKAEAKAKLDEAENAWQKWLWIALGIGMLAVAIRAWLRRRG